MEDKNKYLDEGKKIFKYRFFIRISFDILFFMAYPVSAIVYNHTNANVATLTLVLMIASAFITTFILNFKFWKCPKCEKNFKMRSMDRITHCPYCGIRLR